MAGKLGHVQIPLHGLLDDGQPLPVCNGGFVGDAESTASLTGIEKNLLPQQLTRFRDHELGSVEPVARAAQLVRAHGENGDVMALKLFERQAMALGRLFTVAANYSDPDAYFVGGGVVEAKLEFREWFLAKVREHTHCCATNRHGVATFALAPDLDMAGARRAALAALASATTG